MKTIIKWYVFGKTMESVFPNFNAASETLEMLIGNGIEFTVTYKF